MPRDDHQGHRETHVSGLAGGQEPRQNLHARTDTPGWTSGAEAIGVDEIAIRKGHVYRIVVSDLEKRRAIWFGGEGRTEEDMDLFYAFLGKENAGKIRLAVMEMWKAFRNSKQRNAPQPAVLLDKFHILRHLSDALDEVRRSEYKRLTGDDRACIKGQRYVLLSKRGNLGDDGRKNLEKLLNANARLNVAYLLREQFGQLWSYYSEPSAQAFFAHWKVQLEGQDLKPYEKFAAMIGRHWDGIAAYCRPGNKVALGFVEGLNKKIRVLQRRAYGLRDENKPSHPIRRHNDERSLSIDA